MSARNEHRIEAREIDFLEPSRRRQQLWSASRRAESAATFALSP